MRRNTSHRVSELIPLNAISPMEASVWTKIAKFTLNLKIKMTKRVLTTLLLRRLMRRNTGTNDIESFVRNIPRKFHRKQMRMRMLKTKLDDAIYQERKIRNLFTSRYEYLRRRWGNNRHFMTNFNAIMQAETRFVWETGRERVRSKVDNLCEKWHEKSRARVPDMIEYVAISDHALETRFGPVQKEAPVVYGGVGITEAEAAVAGLGPKFCVTPRLSMEDVQVAVEEVLTKIRWEDRSRDERDGEQWTPEYQIEKNLFHTVYDEENGVLDFRKKRVTDLKTNRRIIIPDPSENIVNNTPIEVGFANIKTRIDNFVKVNMKTKFDQRGFPRKTNLNADEMKGLKSLQRREDVFVTASDKTKKLCINTKENYVTRMGTHLAGNEEIDWGEKQVIEKNINAHAVQIRLTKNRIRSHDILDKVPTTV